MNFSLATQHRTWLVSLPYSKTTTLVRFQVFVYWVRMVCLCAPGTHFPSNSAQPGSIWFSGLSQLAIDVFVMDHWNVQIHPRFFFVCLKKETRGYIEEAVGGHPTNACCQIMPTMKKYFKCCTEESGRDEVREEQPAGREAVAAL